MRYVLLTWNPGPDDEDQYTPEQWLEEIVIPLQAGEQPDADRWSIGTNWKSIEVGDAVCMLRQGTHGRGIVAVGSITEAAFLGAHWNLNKGGEAHYVRVAWHRALDLNQMITIDELVREVPGFEWNKVYSSGRIVDGPPAADLSELLGQGSGGATAQREEGQQYGAAEHNRLVEMEAMATVEAGYRNEGYNVTDVSSQNLGWDLTAQRGETVAHVEVKGATGPRPDFFMTPNEYRAAQDQAGWVAVVITGIFAEEPEWYELSAEDVVDAALPTQYRVTG